MKTRNVLIAAAALAIGGPQLVFAQDHALVIGNSDYAGCANDLPGVMGDVLNKNNALKNADWTVNIRLNRTAAQMLRNINKKVDALSPGKNYIVWYAGHGNGNNDGALVGVDCNDLTPNEFVTALKGRDACSGASL